LSLVSGPVYPSNPNGNNIGFSAGCMAMSEWHDYFCINKLHCLLVINNK
jgi:hypothetical protein